MWFAPIESPLKILQKARNDPPRISTPCPSFRGSPLCGSRFSKFLENGNFAEGGRGWLLTVSTRATTFVRGTFSIRSPVWALVLMSPPVFGPFHLDPPLFLHFWHFFSECLWVCPIQRRLHHPDRTAGRASSLAWEMSQSVSEYGTAGYGIWTTFQHS